MIRRLLIIILCHAAIGSARCQYFQYSQYNYASQRVNPASVASSDYASVGLLFRQQGTGGDINLKSSLISAVYPLLSKATGRRWSGIGITAMDDRAGGIFNTREASLSYAINAYLSRFQTLSLGIKGLYQLRNVNLDGLFTGSQYIPDRGFDPTKFNGENLSYLKSDFFTFSAGLYWQTVNRRQEKVASWGISFFDFNKPQDSFSNTESELNSTIILHGSFRVFEEEQLAVTPDLLFTRSASNNVVAIGGVTSYTIQPFPNQVAGRVDVITRYAVGRSGIVGLQLHRDNFSIGFSYDFPVGKTNIGNTGAFEVGLELRKLVDPYARARKKRIAARKPSPRQPQVEQAPTASKPLPKDTTQVVSRQADLQHKQDSVIATAKAGNIKHQPLVVEKITLHFNFEFNSSALDEQSTRYLDDLSEALRENLHLSVKLTGHTDNIGSQKFNQRLSVHRANAVKDYLVERGIDPARIETDGKGMTEPLNENRTEDERAMNRRVDLVIFYED